MQEISLYSIKMLPWLNFSEPSGFCSSVSSTDRSEYSTISYLLFFLAMTPTFSEGLRFGSVFKDAWNSFKDVKPS